MAGLCKATVIGNLGRDAEIRATQDGRSMARFSVAASTRRRDREGNWQDHTEWFSVTLFGRQAETLKDRLVKGARVYVEGRLETRKFDGANGPGFSLDLIANELILTDPRVRDGDGYGGGDEGDEGGSAGNREPSRPPARANAGAPRAAQAASDDTDFEDLPF